MCGEGEPLSPILQVKMGKRQIVEDASPCQAAVSMLATQDVSPGHSSHLLGMDVLSPAREGGLPVAGRVTAWELGAHRLRISCPTVLLRLKWAMCPQPRLASRGWESQQDSPGRDSWQNGRRTSDTAPPAPCHTDWDGSRGTMALLLQLPNPI